MKREISDINILNDFTEKFCNIVNKFCNYIIVSGFIAISSGRARGTEDIDMIIEKIDLNTFEKIHNNLLKHNFVCIQSENFEEIYEYLNEGASIRYTWKNKPLPEMEIKFAKDKLDEIQLENKVKLELTDLDIWFSEIEMNIAFKEEYLKSDKDFEDSRHLRIVYEDDIDRKKIEEYKFLIKRYRL